MALHFAAYCLGWPIGALAAVGALALLGFSEAHGPVDADAAFELFRNLYFVFLLATGLPYFAFIHPPKWPHRRDLICDVAHLWEEQQCSLHVSEGVRTASLGKLKLLRALDVATATADDMASST